MKGDLFGNLGKWFTGYQPKIQQPQQYQQNQHKENHEQRVERANHSSNDALERVRRANGMLQMQERRGGEQEREPSYHSKHRKSNRNGFE